MVWSKMNTRDAPVLDTKSARRQVEVDDNDLRIFEQLLSLRVVDSLDLVVVDKVFLDTFVVVYLEAILVKSEILFLASDVMNSHTKRFGRPFVRLWFPHIIWGRFAAIAGIFVVVQCGVDMVWFCCLACRLGLHFGLQRLE